MGTERKKIETFNVDQGTQVTEIERGGYWDSKNYGWTGACNIVQEGTPEKKTNKTHRIEELS